MIYRLALGMAVEASTGLMVIRTRVSARTVERVRQGRYDAGYQDGYEIGRASTVVPLRVAASDGLALSGGGSPHQFGE